MEIIPAIDIEGKCAVNTGRLRTKNSNEADPCWKHVPRQTLCRYSCTNTSGDITRYDKMHRWDLPGVRHLPEMQNDRQAGKDRSATFLKSLVALQYEIWYIFTIRTSACTVLGSR